MGPIAPLTEEHAGLLRKLQRFSFADTAKIVGGLAVCPELYSHLIRIEVLQHFVAMSCAGTRTPNREDIVDWLGRHMRESSAASMEDPIEDVFIGYVASDFGGFRLITGNLSDADFWIERLLRFIAGKPEFPPFRTALETVLPLLKLADAIVERIGLDRYSAGGGLPFGRVEIPQWRTLSRNAEAVVFSAADLQHLGIDPNALRAFVFDAQRKTQLKTEEIGNSSLERCPLIELNDCFIAIAPSSFSRAVLRVLLGHITEGMGGWADTFFQTSVAEEFVNDVRLGLKIKPLDFDPPKIPAGLPPLYPFFGFFDTGKPVIMLTHCLPLSQSVTNFNGIDDSASHMESDLRQYLNQCAEKFEAMPGFSGGLVLLNLSGIALWTVLGIPRLRPKWHMHAGSLADWLILTANGGCTAMQLWKLAEHGTVVQNRKIRVVNLAGLVNAYSYWKDNGFRLIPRDRDSRSLTLITINSDFAGKFRTQLKQQQDFHCVLSHDGQRWVRLMRKNIRSLFKEDASLLHLPICVYS
jgi:hypothetical protein